MASVVRKPGEVNNEVFADELKPGTQLLHGQFTIESFLNSGGFGITYLARDSLDRQVVIKECFPGSFCRRSKTIVGARSRAHQIEFRSIVKLFVQEAFNLSKLKHPNIVGVHQVFEDNDTAYMAMDYVEGFDLLETLEEGATRLNPAEILGVLQKVLAAVGFVHSQGVLHRDISPDNILMNKATGNPVLIDFGAAREEVSKASRALSAMRVVKDGYSPQEFYINGSEQGPSSDLYALAATFYHLITGNTPTNSQTRLSAVASRDPDPYVPLFGTVNGYPPAFLKAIDKAMSVFPKDRIQSADAWLAMIAPDAKDMAIPAEAARAKSVRVVSEKVAVVSATVSRSPKSLLAASAAAIAIVASLAAWQSGLLSGADSVAVAAVPTPVKKPAKVETVASLPEAKPADNGGETVIAALDASVPKTPVRSGDAAEAMTEKAAPVDAAADRLTETSALPPGVELISPPKEPVIADTAVEVPVTATAETAASAPTDIEKAAVETVTTEAVPSLAEEAPVAETVVPDVAPESVVAAAEPVAEPAVAVEPAAAPVAEVAPVVVEPDRPVTATQVGMSASLAVSMPFTTDAAQRNVIASVRPGAPAWMQPGQRIVEVNGLPVRSSNDLRDVMGRGIDLGAQSEVQVIFGVQAFEGSDIIYKTEVLPVVEYLVLDNGLAFETVASASGPQTLVSAVPATADADLQVGDVLIAYSATQERVDAAKPLAAILSREIEKKVATFGFAVQRDGGMIVAFFTIPVAG